jgi:uncharacterized protein (TIGR03437 family)
MTRVLLMVKLRVIVLISFFAISAGAQSSIPWDTSGNGMLQGTYYFRQVAYQAADQFGDIGAAAALFGTINFDGNGHYTVSAQLVSSSSGSRSYSVSGTYGIASSGLGYIDSLLINNESIVGLVSNGVFVGSSTQSLSVNDLFVAVQAGGSPASNATLNGTYWVASMNFPSGDPTQARDGLFSMTVDGNGNVTGNLTIGGYIGLSSARLSQTVQGARYSFNNGVATFSFPAGSTPSAQILVSGDKVTYVSADGSFLVGGSATGFDILMGVRAGTSNAAPLDALYYLAGLREDNSLATQGYAQLSTYYGSARIYASGVALRHEQISPFDAATYNFFTDDAYAPNSDGSYDQSAATFAAGANGSAVVGIGKGPFLGIFAGVMAPAFSGSGVYLNPTGVVNAASSAPFTAGIARGELITLYGSNLAPDAAVAQAPFPTTLNGVQVLINNRAAPIYYVSPGQVSVIVPYATELSYAQISVINNGAQSNTVTVLMNTTAPGAFTVPPGGIGYGAVLHADFSLVTPSSPAKAGETVLIFVTGLGDVNPAVADGAPGPSNPFSLTVNPLAVYFAGPGKTVQGAVTYAGLAPGLAGLYQINVQLPSTIASGDNYIEIQTADSYSTQAKMPVQ